MGVYLTCFTALVTFQQRDLNKSRAMSSVKAKGVISLTYPYYQPGIRGETLGNEVNVN